MVDVFKELADSSRREILKELRLGPRRVADLVAATGLKQPNVSNHLAKLREKGLLGHKKVGREVIYFFADQEAFLTVCAAFSKPSGAVHSSSLKSRAESYARLAAEGDEEASCHLVCELVKERTPLLSIYSDVLGPALRRIGDWYGAGTVDEACEHAATAISERIMSRLMQFYSPMIRCDKKAILGCAAGNRHCVGLRMASDLLQSEGWTTVFLGGDVPLPAFKAAVTRHSPDLVLASCTTEAALEPTLELVTAISRHGATIGVGGQVAQEQAIALKRAGADWVVGNLKEFASEVFREPAVLQTKL